MEKRKPRRSEILVADESALAKSAAWAWYERGSGSYGRSIREADVWRPKGDPIPSRYKLEALRKVQHDQNSTSCNKNSLLDKYEIEMISRQLDYYIESSHAKYHGGDSGNVAAATKNKVVQKKKIPKGFWFRHVPAACGTSRDDVAEYRHGPPGKRLVAVAEVVGCRPRPWGIRV